MNYKHFSQIERYQISSLMKAQHSRWRVNWWVEMKNAPEGASLLGSWRGRIPQYKLPRFQMGIQI